METNISGPRTHINTTNVLFVLNKKHEHFTKQNFQSKVIKNGDTVEWEGRKRKRRRFCCPRYRRSFLNLSNTILHVVVVQLLSSFCFLAFKHKYMFQYLLFPFVSKQRTRGPYWTFWPEAWQQGKSLAALGSFKNGWGPIILGIKFQSALRIKTDLKKKKLFQ